MKTATPAGSDGKQRHPVLRSTRMAIAALACGALAVCPTLAQDPVIQDPALTDTDPVVAEPQPVSSDPQPAPEPLLPAPESDAQRPLPPELLAVPGVRQGMDSQQLMDVVKASLDTRQLDDAEKILRYMASRNPDLMQANSLLAYTCELQMEVYRDPAGGDAGKAESYKSDAVRYYLRAGKLALDQRLYSAAKSLFERVMRYEPTNPDMKLGLARLHAATQRNMLAIELYNEYIKSTQGRKDSQAWLELGQIYHQSGFIGQAVSTLQKAVEMNPENPEIHFELAVTFLDDRRLDQAREAAVRAMQKGVTKPNYHKYVNLHAMIQFTAKEWNEATIEAAKAIRLAREALAGKPDDVDLLRAAVTYHETLERILKAKIEAAPEEIGYRIDLARSIADKSAANRLLGLHAALQALPRLEGEYRSNIQLLELTAELQFNVHKLAECAETCKRLLELDGDNARGRDLLQRLPAEVLSAADGDSGTGNGQDAATP